MGRCGASAGSPALLYGEGFGESLDWGLRGDWRPTRLSLRLRMGDMEPRGLEARLDTVLLGLWFTVSRKSSLVSVAAQPLVFGLGLESTIKSSGEREAILEIQETCHSHKEVIWNIKTKLMSSRVQA